MKSALMLIMLALTLTPNTLSQNRVNNIEEELTNLEKEFARAIVSNDAKAIDGFLSDDWIIIDTHGGIIDKARFIAVIRSGTLTHDVMESSDLRIRIYGDTAVVTALAKTKGKFSGNEFTTEERATDIFVRKNDRWLCVLSQLSRYDKK